MWQNAASYTAADGGVCGIHLRELEEGRGELVLFYDRQASRVVRSQFETYVADHLRLRALPGTLTRRANSPDKKQVMAIGERLKERGILPWLDIWEIRPERDGSRNCTSSSSGSSPPRSSLARRGQGHGRNSRRKPC
jgi:hypothetical protein